MPIPTTIVSPPRAGGPRLGRLIGAVVFLFLVFGLLMYALYLIAGALEDEPMRAMIPNPEFSQAFDSVPQGSRVRLPDDILSSAQSHPAGPTNLTGGTR